MKNIVKTLALAALTLAFCTSAVAQEAKPKPKKEKMTPEQVATIQAKDIAHSLGLDDATTEKFTKTFCAYRMEIRQANQEKKVIVKGVPRKDMTEQQVEEQIKAQFAHSHKVISIREKYYGEFRKCLNPRQIQRVYELEKRQSEKMKAQQKQRKEQKKAKANAKAK
ncbi:MAG: hypothetical protein IJF01_07695 [Tidjanibacter sp.]|nr:hypothetical protein [Tidjanibacter sp.]